MSRPGPTPELPAVVYEPLPQRHHTTPVTLTYQEWEWVRYALTFASNSARAMDGSGHPDSPWFDAARTYAAIDTMVLEQTMTDMADTKEQETP